MTRLPSGALAVMILTASSFAQQLAPVRVLSITAGPAGSENSGGFVLHEERSVFSRATDREVIVLFQWEDVPGAHKLVAQWRSPDGAASVNSAIDYKAAEKRFGALWRLPTSPSMSLGTWSIDVTMDGRPAGRFTFEISDAKIEAATSRRPLTEAEIYERLNASFAVLRRSGRDKRDLDTAAAFRPVPDTGRLYTVVAAIDSADSLRAILADRSTHELNSLVDWNRQQQWAVLGGPVSKGSTLAVRAADTPVKIGSRCFSIEGSVDGVRVLLVGTITGQTGTVAERPALVATFGNAFGMPGAPVIDEYGELFGIVGVGMPGDPRPIEHVVEARGDLKGVPVIPFAVVGNQPSTPPLAFDQLRSSGQLMPGVVEGHVASAGFVRGKGGNTAGGYINRFTSADQVIGLVVAWSPTERLRGQAVLRLFDAENRLVASSRPRRVNFGKGSYMQARWEIPTPPKAGFYRVDLLIDTTTFWRGFLRVDP